MVAVWRASWESRAQGDGDNAWNVVRSLGTGEKGIGVCETLVEIV